MYFIMRLGEREIARRKFIRTIKLSEIIAELKNEYAEELAKSKDEPEFYLEHVPSVTSNFQQLSSK